AIIKPGAAHLPGRKKAKILVPRTRWYASCQEQTRTRSLLQLSCLPGRFDSEIKTTVCCWRIFFSVKHRRMCLFAYSGWRLMISAASKTCTSDGSAGLPERRTACRLTLAISYDSCSTDRMNPLAIATPVILVTTTPAWMHLALKSG